jgi:hypothetical protein
VQKAVIAIAEAMAISLHTGRRHGRIAEARMMLEGRRTPIRHIAVRGLVAIVKALLLDCLVV